MKHAFLMLLIAVFAVGAAHAQKEQSRINEQTRVFKRFQTAVAKNNKTAVAAMINYPFTVSTGNGDGSEYKLETKADLIKNYARIFNAARRQNIARAKYLAIPDEDEFNAEMEDETTGLHFYRFRKIGAAYFWVYTIIIGDVQNVADKI